MNSPNPLKRKLDEVEQVEAFKKQQQSTEFIASTSHDTDLRDLAYGCNFVSPHPPTPVVQDEVERNKYIDGLISFYKDIAAYKRALDEQNVTLNTDNNNKTAIIEEQKQRIKQLEADHKLAQEKSKRKRDESEKLRSKYKDAKKDRDNYKKKLNEALQKCEAALHDRDEAIQERDDARRECEEKVKERDMAVQERDALARQCDELQRRLAQAELTSETTQEFKDVIEVESCVFKRSAAAVVRRANTLPKIENFQLYSTLPPNYFKFLEHQRLRILSKMNRIMTSYGLNACLPDSGLQGMEKVIRANDFIIRQISQNFKEHQSGREEIPAVPSASAISVVSSTAMDATNEHNSANRQEKHYADTEDDEQSSIDPNNADADNTLKQPISINEHEKEKQKLRDELDETLREANAIMEQNKSLFDENSTKAAKIDELKKEVQQLEERILEIQTNYNQTIQTTRAERDQMKLDLDAATGERNAAKFERDVALRQSDDFERRLAQAKILANQANNDRQTGYQSKFSGPNFTEEQTRLLGALRERISEVVKKRKELDETIKSLKRQQTSGSTSSI